MHTQSVSHVRDLILEVCRLARHYHGRGLVVVDLYGRWDCKTSLGEATFEDFHDAVCVGMTMRYQLPILKLQRAYVDQNRQ
jgi:hypothetical protein